MVATVEIVEVVDGVRRSLREKSVRGHRERWSWQVMVAGLLHTRAAGYVGERWYMCGLGDWQPSRWSRKSRRSLDRVEDKIRRM